MDYETLVSPENIFLAFDEFKRGKRKKKDVMAFERDLETNVFALSRELSAHAYRHGPYSTFMVSDPKPRVINKASVRDRLVHHILFRYLNGIFDKTFLFHSYASRKGKGTHLGVAHLRRMMGKASANFSKPCFALQCDIRKFFASINHDILYVLIAQKVADKDILGLIKEVIGSHSTHTHTHTHTH